MLIYEFRRGIFEDLIYILLHLILAKDIVNFLDKIKTNTINDREYYDKLFLIVKNLYKI